MLKPTLSVVMTNYNHSQYLPQTIEAFLNQSWCPDEIIIIDDNSTDNSVEIIRHYAKKEPFIQVHQNPKNMGPLFNVNRLYQMASGEYIHVASADDMILPGFFEKSMHLLTQYSQAGLCSTHALRIDEEGRSRGILHMPAIARQGCFIPAEKALNMIKKYGSWIQGNTTILRRRALVDCGGYLPELHAFCDGFAYLVIAAKYGVCFIPEPLAAWRKSDNSYSATIAKDPDLPIQCIRHAKGLMSSQYRDLFTADFVNSWEKREIINDRLMRHLNLLSTSCGDLKKTIPSQNRLDKCLFALRREITKFEYVIIKSYLYHRAGLPANQLYIQRAKQFLRAVRK